MSQNGDRVLIVFGVFRFFILAMVTMIIIFVIQKTAKGRFSGDVCCYGDGCYGACCHGVFHFVSYAFSLSCHVSCHASYRVYALYGASCFYLYVPGVSCGADHYALRVFCCGVNLYSLCVSGGGVSCVWPY